MFVYLKNNHHKSISSYLPSCKAPQGFSAKKLIAKARFWANRSHQRRQLARLDARMLADIGISEEQLKIEVAKPFWR